MACCFSAAVALGIDQFPHQLIVDGSTGGGNHKQAVRLPEIPAPYDWKMDAEDGSYYRVKPTRGVRIHGGRGRRGREQPDSVHLWRLNGSVARWARPLSEGEHMPVRVIDHEVQKPPRLLR
jgi:hypothetical protein